MSPSESSVIELPGRDVVAAEALSWPDRARAAVVTDAASYQRTAELLLGIKALRKRVAEVHDPNIKRWVDGHRAALRDKADADTPLTEAEGIIKASLSAYDRQQEQIRQDEQRKADAEARRREEDQRVALAAEMEREGQQYGDVALVREAEALIAAAPPPVVAAPVAKATPKVAGISYRDTWKFRVVNPALVPTQYKVTTINESAIRAVVNGLKGNTSIPGVEVYCERTVAAGGR